jgi:hypothetical protein
LESLLRSSFFDQATKLPFFCSQMFALHESIIQFLRYEKIFLHTSQFHRCSELLIARPLSLEHSIVYARQLFIRQVEQAVKLCCGPSNISRSLQLSLNVQVLTLQRAISVLVPTHQQGVFDLAKSIGKPRTKSPGSITLLCDLSGELALLRRTSNLQLVPL